MRVILLLVILTVAMANQQLRTHDLQHDLSLPFIGDLNPIQMAQLMSGDFASVLPAPLQPLARKILGQEQKAGASGFMNSISSMLGGGSGSGSSSMFGGLGDLLGGGGSGSQAGGVMQNMAKAFGGSSGSGSGSSGGFLSSLGLPF